MQETLYKKYKMIELADSPPDITVLNPNWISIDADMKALEETKVNKIDGKSLSTNDYTTDEKNKLATIEPQANKYVHPNTEMIRHTTDAEKNTWNSKATTDYVDTKTSDLDRKLTQQLNTKANEATVTSQLATKSDIIHAHGWGSITDKPTSMLANGGNADTVGGNGFLWEFGTGAPTHIWGQNANNSRGRSQVWSPSSLSVGHAINCDNVRNRDLCSEVDGLKQSVVDGKKLVANAINGKAGSSLNENHTFNDYTWQINQLRVPKLIYSETGTGESRYSDSIAYFRYDFTPTFLNELNNSNKNGFLRFTCMQGYTLGARDLELFGYEGSNRTYIAGNTGRYDNQPFVFDIGYACQTHNIYRTKYTSFAFGFETPYSNNENFRMSLKVEYFEI